MGALRWQQGLRCMRRSLAGTAAASHCRNVCRALCCAAIVFSSKDVHQGGGVVVSLPNPVVVELDGQLVAAPLTGPRRLEGLAGPVRSGAPCRI